MATTLPLATKADRVGMIKNDGFTLIEVLIAMLILGIGLLGLAALQGTSLANNQSAYNRSQATHLAYDMADRIRANRTDAATSVYVATLPSAATCATGDTPCTACQSLSSNVCSQAQLAMKDLYDWQLALSNTLYGSVGSITRTGTAANAVYTISVQWDDDRDPNTSNLSFAMSFQL